MALWVAGGGDEDLGIVQEVIGKLGFNIRELLVFVSYITTDQTTPTTLREILGSIAVTSSHGYDYS